GSDPGLPLTGCAACAPEREAGWFLYRRGQEARLSPDATRPAGTGPPTGRCCRPWSGPWRARVSFWFSVRFAASAHRPARGHWGIAAKTVGIGKPFCALLRWVLSLCGTRRRHPTPGRQRLGAEVAATG